MARIEAVLNVLGKGTHYPATVPVDLGLGLRDAQTQNPKVLSP